MRSRVKNAKTLKYAHDIRKEFEDKSKRLETLHSKMKTDKDAIQQFTLEERRLTTQIDTAVNRQKNAGSQEIKNVNTRGLKQELDSLRFNRTQTQSRLDNMVSSPNNPNSSDSSDSSDSPVGDKRQSR